jgi:methionine-R-sulfoxide reductase
MKNILFAAGLVCFFAACNETGKKSNKLPAAEMPAIVPDSNWTTTIEKTAAEWKKELTSKQFYITREQGTEMPFSSEYTGNHEKGIYFCVCCHNPLFSSATKFESGTGWPSFYRPYSLKSVKSTIDQSEGISRNEISCQRCHAHLGHVFDDGPAPTGLRYCMDGVALLFQKESTMSK